MTNKYRQYFPALSTKVHNKNLVYLDNAATALTLDSVIESEKNYYQSNSSNVHRGVHSLSQEATNQFEETRLLISKYINASSSDEIIFTSGTTDSINLLASCLGFDQLNAGDEILISTLEHHSNIVPWHLVAKQKKLLIKEIPIDQDGNILIEKVESLITTKTKVISFTMASNTLGNITPYKELTLLAKKHNLISIIDAAQAAPHLKIDVQDIDCDFLALSAHKMFGPTGVGILFGKSHLLQKLPPYQGGGGMIDNVDIDHSSYLEAPQKFEPGTPNISGVIAFGKAIQFLLEHNIQFLENIEKELLLYAHQKLATIPGLQILGTKNLEQKVSVISFLLDQIHPTDVGMLLDEQGIAIRTGHHCTQPLMKHLKISGTCRASFSFYNTKDEVDLLYNGLLKVKSFF